MDKQIAAQNDDVPKVDMASELDRKQEGASRANRLFAEGIAAHLDVDVNRVAITDLVADTRHVSAVRYTEGRLEYNAVASAKGSWRIRFEIN